MESAVLLAGKIKYLNRNRSILHYDRRLLWCMEMRSEVLNLKISAHVGLYTIQNRINVLLRFWWNNEYT